MTSRYRRDALSVAHLTGWELCPTSEGQLSNCFAPRPPCGHGLEGTGRTVFLRDVCSSRWQPLKPFISQSFNDGINLCQGHAIGSLIRHAVRHRAFVSVDFPVGCEVQVPVVQEFVDSL